MADDGDADALLVFRLREHAAERRPHTQHAPERPGYFPRRHLLWLAAPGERRVGSLGLGEIREDRIEAAPFDPLSRSGIVFRGHVGLAHLVPDHHEAIRLGIWKRPDQY